MNQKQRDISTVIIVNKGNQRTKTIQVKTKHLGRLKHYAFGIFRLIVLLVGYNCLPAVPKQPAAKKKKQLLSQLSALKGCYSRCGN